MVGRQLVIPGRDTPAWLDLVEESFDQVAHAVRLICPGEPTATAGVVPLAMEDAMAKALETNDNTAQNQERRPLQSADEPRPEELEGKSFQVNENSVEQGEPVDPSAPPPQPSEAKPNGQKIQGKAFQVNENSK
jgi:hypothetical protein